MNTRLSLAAPLFVALALALPGCSTDASDAPVEESDLTANPLAVRAYAIHAADEDVFTSNDDIFGVYFKRLELRADKTFKASVTEVSFDGDGTFDASRATFDIEGKYSVSTRYRPARAVFRYPVTIGGVERNQSIRFYVKKEGGKVLFSSDRQFLDSSNFRME